MRIQHNIMAMSAYRNYNTNTSALSKNLEKLSSGYKINRAGDDAAGLAISEKMRAQITGLDAAQKNVKDGISLVKTAEGAMQEIQDMLNRMDYLATQSANGTYQDEVDRENLQKEVTALKDEINRIADSANFNGIKLLDGSLDSKTYKANSSVEKVEVGGNIDSDYVIESAGSAGKYTTGATMGTWTGIKEGSSYEFTVSMDDGASVTVKLTAALEDNKDSDDYGKVKYLVAEDGKKYELASAITNDGAGAITLGAAATPSSNAEKLQSALRKELEKTAVGDNFKISFNNTATTSTGGGAVGTVTLEAKEIGTGAVKVNAFDYATTNENGVRTDGANMGVVTSQTALDAGFEIDVSQLTEYNGENADEAIFTINGHKFVILADDNDTTKNDPSTNDYTNSSYLRAAQALGTDVTILTGGIGGLKADGTAGTGASSSNPSLPAAGAPDGTGTPDPTKPATNDAANNNFTQNIKKIAEVTGLTVTGSLDESDFNKSTTVNTGVSYGGGIRLSAGKTETVSSGKPLTLQIGDTADSFNQMKVSVGNMHTYAMGSMDKDGKVTKGIADVDIGTQEGAAEAVQVIRDAINYVSGVRGDLGAVQNRLEHTGNNLSIMAENIQDAESTIRDTDVANEMMSYVKNNILVQSAQAMLAQANQVPQGVLQLLG